MLVAEPMMIPRGPEPRLNLPTEAAPIPRQVEMIISALDSGQFGRRERRSVARADYRVEAALRLFSDTADTPPWVLYTRDANARGLGFITPHRLPLGYGGLLEIVVPDGRKQTLACTLLRCREVAPGWNEGSLYFNRQQADFAV